jgi:hypothetical protein
MADAYINDNNTIFEKIIRKGETYSRKMFRLEAASIWNKFYVNQRGHIMIPCVYKRTDHVDSGFLLKIEDAREKMARILNLMMDLYELPHGTIPCLAKEIIHNVAECLGSEPKENYTPNDFSPCYQLAYKGPLPEFISFSDVMTLYELGHVDLVKSMFYAGDYFVMSDESFYSCMNYNPKLYWFIKNVYEMRYSIEKILKHIKGRGGRW